MDHDPAPPELMHDDRPLLGGRLHPWTSLGFYSNPTGAILRANLYVEDERQLDAALEALTIAGSYFRR